LTRWRKGDKRKLRIGLWLRRETTTTLKWMAEQLAMGTSAVDYMKQELKKRWTPFRWIDDKRAK